MNKKEILEKKNSWIKALEATICKYEEILKSNDPSLYFSERCPLCILASTMKEKLTKYQYDNYHQCFFCIHKSPFSQGVCMSQQSFLAVIFLLDHTSEIDTELAKNTQIRIDYLKSLKNNLIKEPCE